MKPLGQEYLGDGVYASTENGMLVLRTESSVGCPTPSVIFLEPEVLYQLLAFARQHGLVHK